MQEIDSKHPLRSCRRASFPGLRMEEIKNDIEFLPGSDLLYFNQKLFPLRELLIFLKGLGVHRFFADSSILVSRDSGLALETTAMVLFYTSMKSFSGDLFKGSLDYYTNGVYNKKILHSM